MIGLNEDLKKLETQGKPVKIGLIGTGQMGTDIVTEVSMMKGIDVVITCDVDIQRAKDSYAVGRVSEEVIVAGSAEEADEAIIKGKKVAVSDYNILTQAKNIDVVIESTGIPEIGARASLSAIRNNHSLAMMNVETDITIGPLLRWYSEKKGQLYSLAAGDEPAACKQLYDFADALGFTIVAAGKGKNNPLNRYASPQDPEIQKDAARRGLNPYMLVEFVDGSKTMIEMAAVSNATGLVPDIRGMHGPESDRTRLHKTFALKEDGGVLNNIGVIEYAVGNVAPGVFLIIRTDHPRLREAMVLRDMGDGPYYTLFRPFHLCSIEVPLTCAMLAIRKKPDMVPLDHLVSEVFAVAKRDLKAGEHLDSIGGITHYSLVDSYKQASLYNLLPIGLAKGAQVIKDIKKDQPITLKDVNIKNSAVYTLRKLQDSWMSGKITEGSLLKEIDLVF